MASRVVALPLIFFDRVGGSWSLMIGVPAPERRLDLHLLLHSQVFVPQLLVKIRVGYSSDTRAKCRSKELTLLGDNAQELAQGSSGY